MSPRAVVTTTPREQCRCRRLAVTWWSMCTSCREQPHRPFTDDGVTYCGWDGHDGCGEVWPCSTVLFGADNDTSTATDVGPKNGRGSDQ
jgi:hypothetical protein